MRVVADDFRYRLETTRFPHGPDAGYNGGANGSTGAWTSGWQSVGDARINVLDHPRELQEVVLIGDAELQGLEDLPLGLEPAGPTRFHAVDGESREP